MSRVEPLVLRVGEEKVLREWTRAASGSAGLAGLAGLAQRARILLLAAQGHSNTEIGRLVGVSLPTVRLWRSRYGAGGVGGLGDLARSGRGSTAVDTHTVHEGFQLGAWVARRRSNYHQGTLSPARIAVLEALAGWVWTRAEDRWPPGLTALRTYSTQYGTAAVPAGTLHRRYPLGAWVTAAAPSTNGAPCPRARSPPCRPCPGGCGT